jgi:hypothetical protein
MNYIEKVRYLRDKYDTLPKVGVKSQLYFSKNKWEIGELDFLKNIFNFLPKSYLAFIEEFETIGLGWFTFYGSKKSEIISIEDELNYWSENSKGEYFPIGKDAGGNIFAFNTKGNIICFKVEDYDWQSPIFIAINLENFVDDCLLGKRYEEFNKIENNFFYDFLKSQKWIC